MQKTTMSALRERYQWLRIKIEAHAMFFLQTFQVLININLENIISEHRVLETRNRLIQIRQDNTLLSKFQDIVNKHLSDIHQLFELTANTFVQFTVSENLVIRLENGHIFHEDILTDLYQYLLRLFYTKPHLILLPDTGMGTYHDLMKEALVRFVVESIPLRYV